MGRGGSSCFDLLATPPGWPRLVGLKVVGVGIGQVLGLGAAHPAPVSLAHPAQALMAGMDPHHLGLGPDDRVAPGDVEAHVLSGAWGR